MSDVKLLFVCMGNICRSPTAEGVFRELVRQRAPELPVTIDSAGTHGYHVGHPPDARSAAAAELRGIDLGSIRSRMVDEDDFEAWDLIVAMDRSNLADLRERCPPGLHDRIVLMMDFAPRAGVRDVPDPYYGGPNGFEQVLDLVEAACEGLLEDVRRRLAGA